MTQHATSMPPSDTPETSYAERARTLLERESVGTLSTHSERHPGWPFGSVMPYALTFDGAPLILISGMAMHTKNLLADPRASLLVMQSGNETDPLGMARVTLLGSVNRIEYVSDELRQAYLHRHPNAKQWIEYSDFGFFRLDVSNIYFVGGFGAMGWIDRDEYVAATADPLADVAEGIIEHMNRDHAAALREIARHFAKLDAEEATMVSCDRLGFVLRARTAEGMKGRRIAFAGEVRSAEDARRVLVAMVRDARRPSNAALPSHASSLASAEQRCEHLEQHTQRAVRKRDDQSSHGDQRDAHPAVEQEIAGQERHEQPVRRHDRRPRFPLGRGCQGGGGSGREERGNLRARKTGESFEKIITLHRERPFSPSARPRRSRPRDRYDLTVLGGAPRERSDFVDRSLVPVVEIDRAVR